MLTQPIIQKTNAKLVQIWKAIGFVPNLYRELNINPATLMVYLQGQEALANGLLTSLEQHAVQLRVSSFNGCYYCQAAHRWLGRENGLSSQDLKAIAQGIGPVDERLAAIVRATNLLLEKKGWLSGEDLSTLEYEGMDRATLYEIVALIGLKTISNYVNHIAHTPVDEQFST